jgi:SAM-dependent methyltransferase
VIRVLKNDLEIQQARTILRAEGCDSSTGWWRTRYSLMYRIRFRCAPEPVALNKSWDVLQILRGIRSEHPDRSSAILDMGSFNSEILLSLWASGYRDLQAIDFNPLGRAIRWYGNNIRFSTGNFYASDFPASSLDAFTALSVIEHGWDQDQFLATAKRVLKPGGTFYVTTDYHREKLDVPEDFRAFGLSYRVFSQRDIENLVRAAEAQGFELIGDVQFSDSEYPIVWEGRKYTFLLLAMRKSRA